MLHALTCLVSPACFSQKRNRKYTRYLGQKNTEAWQYIVQYSEGWHESTCSEMNIEIQYCVSICPHNMSICFSAHYYICARIMTDGNIVKSYVFLKAKKLTWQVLVLKAMYSFILNRIWTRVIKHIFSWAIVFFRPPSCWWHTVRKIYHVGIIYTRIYITFRT